MMQHLPYKDNFQNLEQLFLRVSLGKFHILKFILEGYDNMGLISSYQNDKGIILLRYSKDFAREVMDLLASLSPLLRRS